MTGARRLDANAPAPADLFERIAPDLPASDARSAHYSDLRDSVPDVDEYPNPREDW
jgi:hypothetical protein